jgi:hypothetical protein
LGRRLHELLNVDHVSYPDETPTVVVNIWGVGSAMSPQVQASIEAVIGPFDVALVEA